MAIRDGHSGWPFGMAIRDGHSGWPFGMAIRGMAIGIYWIFFSIAWNAAATDNSCFFPERLHVNGKLGNWGGNWDILNIYPHRVGHDLTEWQRRLLHALGDGRPKRLKELASLFTLPPPDQTIRFDLTILRTRARGFFRPGRRRSLATRSTITRNDTR